MTTADAIAAAFVVVDVVRATSVVIVDALDLASRPTSVRKSCFCIASFASRSLRSLPILPNIKLCIAMFNTDITRYTGFVQVKVGVVLTTIGVSQRLKMK